MMSGLWAMTVSTSLACWAASKSALVSATTSIPSSSKGIAGALAHRVGERACGVPKQGGGVAASPHLGDLGVAQRDLAGRHGLLASRSLGLRGPGGRLWRRLRCRFWLGLRCRFWLGLRCWFWLRFWRGRGGRRRRAVVIVAARGGKDREHRQHRRNQQPLGLLVFGCHDPSLLGPVLWIVGTAPFGDEVREGPGGNHQLADGEPLEGGVAVGDVAGGEVHAGYLQVPQERLLRPVRRSLDPGGFRRSPPRSTGPAQPLLDGRPQSRRACRRTGGPVVR